MITIYFKDQFIKPKQYREKKTKRRKQAEMVKLLIPSRNMQIITVIFLCVYIFHTFFNKHVLLL
jgi:hypothetical protein